MESNQRALVIRQKVRTGTIKIDLWEFDYFKAKQFFSEKGLNGRADR